MPLVGTEDSLKSIIRFVETRKSSFLISAYDTDS